MSQPSNIEQQPCPCQSDELTPKAYQDCCQPLHKGLVAAKTAEQLMRSRYSAHALAASQPDLVDYIVGSWAQDSPMAVSAEDILAWCQNVQWQGLSILATAQGLPKDTAGTVDFCARYKDAQGEAHQHLEHSTFKRQAGDWRFYLGDSIDRKDLGRNSPCPCGSGKKLKKCCG